MRYVVVLAPAIAITTGWVLFEAWLLTSESHLGHVVDITRADNPQGPRLWRVHIKGWIEHVRFDTHVSLIERPPDVGPIPIRGRLIAGKPLVRAPSFPVNFIFAAGFTSLSWFMLLITLGQM